MDVEEFVGWLWECDRRAQETMVDALEATVETTDGAMGWLRATREVETELRRAGRCRQAGEVAYRATVAIKSNCASTGVYESDRVGVTRLARAAGDAALGLVCGMHTESTDTLLRPFLGAMVLSTP